MHDAHRRFASGGANGFEAAGLDDFFAEVLPEQKALKIREVKARGLTGGDGR
jgi:hypothetical protein